MFSAENPWFNIPERETPWLVYGLFPFGYSSIIGKPKAGKSSLVRSLMVSVVKSQTFLGRSIEIPEGTGRVLYLHLDRKDPDWRVAKELRDLGITQEEASRIILRTSEDMKMDDVDETTLFDKRLEWLQDEVKAAEPHLIVIDLMWQFVTAKNSNDYTNVLKGVNKLQDKLREINFGGALIVTLHGRKAVSATDPFDDALGSTGQRGSFSTNIMLTRHRNDALDGQYTIASDQTERDDIYGEIPETVLTRNPDGSLSLGQSVRGIIKETKKAKAKDDKDRLFAFLVERPMSDMDTITTALGMSKKHVLRLIKEFDGLIEATGEGKKGKPFLYSTHDLAISDSCSGREGNSKAQNSMKEFCDAFGD